MYRVRIIVIAVPTRDPPTEIIQFYLEGTVRQQTHHQPSCAELQNASDENTGWHYLYKSPESLPFFWGVRDILEATARRIDRSRG